MVISGSILTRRAFIESATVAAAACLIGCGGSKRDDRSKQSLRYAAHLLDQAAALDGAFRQSKEEGASAVILSVSEKSDPREIQAARDEARNSGLELGFWIEVGRNEEAASAHPEWLHVPQHNEWLQVFPEWEGEQAAVFPWLPLNNRAVFNFQLERVRQVAGMLQAGDLVYLNDVQNPPAGCGCGNLQCRSWDNSPGEKVAPSPYDHQEAYFTTIFLDAVSKSHPQIKFAPVICPECERGITVGETSSPEDQTGYCHTVDCADPCALYYYPGLLRSLAGLERVALLCTYKALNRDIALYGDDAAWVGANISRYGEHAPKDKLVAVLQGWDVTSEEVRAQIDQASAAGVQSFILSKLQLDQSYRPVSVQNGARQRS